MNAEELFKKQSKKKAEEGKDFAKNGRSDDEAPNLTEEEKRSVQDIIDENQVVVFSKSYCPYCRQAKMTLNSIENLEYKVVEMDDGKHDGWQQYIAELAKTKAMPCAANNNTKSVPQIFINQKYTGGADDLTDLYVDKSLFKMLGLAS